MAGITCKHCGETFRSYNSPRYCSAQCKQAALRHQTVCKVCERVFEQPKKGRQATACGIECHRKWLTRDHGKRQVRPCEYCNKPMEFTKNKQDRRWCSPECRRAADDEAMQAKKVSPVCFGCGKDLTPFQRKGWCSGECYSARLRDLYWGRFGVWGPAIKRARRGIRKASPNSEEARWNRSIRGRASAMRKRQAVASAIERRVRKDAAPVDWLDAIQRQQRRLSARAKAVARSKWRRKCDTVARNLRRRDQWQRVRTSYTTS